jgi:hypothetical protein
MCLRGLVRCVLSGNRKLSSQASLPAYPFTTVILGLDPRIHRLTRGMDGRVKPDHDDGEDGGRSGGRMTASHPPYLHSCGLNSSSFASLPVSTNSP